MRKDLTEVVFILDRSGSMEGLETDTIGGFNSMIEKQRNEDGEAYVTTVLFDNEIEMVHDRVAINKIEPMTDETYYVRGCTALLDAMGGAINYISKAHRYAREDDRPEKTIFIITTDGLENASSKYSYDMVKKMVEHEKSKHGWEFIFLGANIDAIDVASKCGIGADRAINFKSDSTGTALNYQAMTGIISAFRSSKCKGDIDSAIDIFSAPIKNYRKHHKK